MNNALVLIDSYREKNLIIDSGLLLLLFVGIHDATHIPKFKRTNKYTLADFELLRNLLARFSKVVTTPSILTEVSNLLGQLSDPLRSAVLRLFSAAANKLVEEYIPSKELAEKSFFPRFGLTDTSIVETARGQVLALTDDFELAGYLASVGIDVLNFNHLRTFA